MQFIQIKPLAIATYLSCPENFGQGPNFSAKILVPWTNFYENFGPSLKSLVQTLILPYVIRAIAKGALSLYKTISNTSITIN